MIKISILQIKKNLKYSEVKEYNQSYKASISDQTRILLACLTPLPPPLYTECDVKYMSPKPFIQQLFMKVLLSPEH